MTYNDKAVLENFHASAIFRILRDENYNILANLKKEEYRSVKTSDNFRLLLDAKTKVSLYYSIYLFICNVYRTIVHYKM